MSRIGVLLVAVLCFGPLTAGAGLIVDTGVPSPAPGAALPALYRDPPPNEHRFQYLAAQFSFAQAHTITGAQGWISGGAAAGAGGPLTIAIYNDGAGGGVPGTELFSTEVSVGNVDADWVGPGDPGSLVWSLGAGTYWISFEFREGSFFNSGLMPNPSPAPLGNEAFFSWDNGLWAPANDADLGVRIYGDAQGTPGIPEPGSLALVALALLVVGASLARQWNQRLQLRWADIRDGPELHT